MTRRPKVGISMKSYQTLPREAVSYAESFEKLLGDEKEIDIFFLPTAVSLYPAAKVLKDTSILYGIQNIGPEANGAFTGENSVESVKALNGSLVELGHYERRTIFRESTDMIAKKVALVLEQGLSPILCIGEEEKLSDKKQLKKVLKSDLESCLKYSDESKFSNLMIAYEPFWAIGKSDAADPEYVHESHRLIRELLEELFGSSKAEKVHIIYGGSVSKDIAYDLANNEDVDGLFVGRFGHDPKKFKMIVNEVKRAKKL